MANADVKEIEVIIRPCGLFRTKSQNLKDMAIILKEKFDSKIPYEISKFKRYGNYFKRKI